MSYLISNFYILTEITLRIVPTGTIDNKPTLVQIVAWYRELAKSKSEPMVLPTLVCIILPRWIYSNAKPGFENVLIWCQTIEFNINRVNSHDPYWMFYLVIYGPIWLKSMNNK